MKKNLFFMRLLACVLVLVMAFSVLPLSSRAEGEAESDEITIYFALPTSWINKTGNTGYAGFDEIKMNVKTAAGEWHQSNMTLVDGVRCSARPSRESGIDCDVYKIVVDRQEVFGGDEFSRLQFQAYINGGWQFQYEYGGTKNSANFDGKMFVEGKDDGPFEYVEGRKMTVYFAVPTSWDYDTIKMNVQCGGAAENTGWHTIEMEKTEDTYQVGEKERTVYKVTFDPYEFFGLYLDYNQLQFQAWKNGGWKAQLKWTNGNASGYDGLIFSIEGDYPEEFIPVEHNPVTVYFDSTFSGMPISAIDLGERVTGTAFYKVDLTDKYTKIVFSSMELTSLEDNARHKRGGSTKVLTIPTDIENPCFVADPNDNIVYNENFLGGFRQGKRGTYTSTPISTITTPTLRSPDTTGIIIRSSLTQRAISTPTDTAPGISTASSTPPSATGIRASLPSPST